MSVARAMLVALVLLASCDTPRAGPDARVKRMLGCIECMAGEQAAVVAMGDSAIPALRAIVLGDSSIAAIPRARASLALGLIGGDTARHVLCEGKAMALAPREHRFIDSALVLAGGSCP